jgi:acyl-CoA thioesterase-1
MARQAPLLLVLLLALLPWAGCERSAPEREAPPASSPQQAPAPPQPAQPPPQGASGPVIVALGDSLTAGFGLAEPQSYPSLLQEKLRAAGYPHRVVNAGVSGDTTAGGLARMDWLLQQPVEIMIVALGANDGLRGVAPEAIRKNLAGIIEKARGYGVRVVLAGMRLPTNYGRDYIRRFEAVYPELAESYDVPFLPFLLKGVAMRPNLNQPDGIHPNAAGTRIVAGNVWEVLEPLLEK